MTDPLQNSWHLISSMPWPLEFVNDWDHPMVELTFVENNIY